MWYTQVNRREFFEIYLGSTKLVESRIHVTSQISFKSEADLTLIWDTDPLEQFTLPCLVITAKGDAHTLLGAVAAAPQAPSPITALSRVISSEEAAQHFDSDILPLNDRIFPALVALVFIEAMLHGDGRLGLRELTPLICKRTLAFAWSKAISARTPTDSLLQLPGRWLDVYSMLNAPPTVNTANRTVEAIIVGLSLLSQINIGIKPIEPDGALAFELLNGNHDSQERAWQRLAACLPRPISIDAFQALSREERGLYLQDTLRRLTLTRNHTDQSEMTAVCAFLATRLAPGSLEHLEVLQSAAQPKLLTWYALYAALQHPKGILSGNNCLGFRVMRDLLRVEEKLAPPMADVSYTELKIIARSGIESIAGRIGHASELLVELIPYISTSFTFQPKNRPRRSEGQQPIDMEATEAPMSLHARLLRTAAELTLLAKDLPNQPSKHSSPKKTRRKPSGS